MPKKIKSLSDVLSQEKEFLNFRKSVKENDVIVMFNEIFPEFKKVVSPSNVHKGVLYLSVENSVLRNEIHQDLEGMECTDCHNPHGGEDKYILY